MDPPNRVRFPICWPFESLHRSLAKFSSRRALVEGGGGICEIRCKNLQGERGRFGRVKAKVIRSPSPLLGERENLITHSAWRRDYHIQKSPLTRRIPPPIPRKGAWKNIKLQENLEARGLESCAGQLPETTDDDDDFQLEKSETHRGRAMNKNRLKYR